MVEEPEVEIEELEVRRLVASDNSKHYQFIDDKGGTMVANEWDVCDLQEWR